ncbi:hypothetical protein ACRALDRAFT_208907 [Sodiomyces alcalophilus JCM 7366]|uniref:uncharacterized protein n=1 Tax=Sodiomyces alcalophilus JCM 7366 TaxID=591952 RepID=UPI0039B5F574
MRGVVGEMIESMKNFRVYTTLCPDWSIIICAQLSWANIPLAPGERGLAPEHEQFDFNSASVSHPPVLVWYAEMSQSFAHYNVQVHGETPPALCFEAMPRPLYCMGSQGKVETIRRLDMKHM